MKVWKCFDCDNNFDDPAENLLVDQESDLRKCCPNSNCRSINIKEVLNLDKIDFSSFEVDTYEYSLPEHKRITFGDLMLEIGRLTVDIDRCEITLKRNEINEIKSDNTYIQFCKKSIKWNSDKIELLKKIIRDLKQVSWSLKIIRNFSWEIACNHYEHNSKVEGYDSPEDYKKLLINRIKESQTLIENITNIDLEKGDYSYHYNNYKEIIDILN